MAEEEKEKNKKKTEEKKPEEEKQEEKKEGKPVEAAKKDEKEGEKKKEEIEPKEKEEKEKTEAVVNVSNLGISTKHSIAICNMIRGKKIETALEKLQLAVNEKSPIKMRGEIPHRKGMMSGRYCVKAASQFIKLLKSLQANANINGLEGELIIKKAIANTASRPYKRFGRGRFKRTNVYLKTEKQKA